MIAIMGPPPLSFLERCGEKAGQYWDKDGQSIDCYIGESCNPLTLQLGTWKNLAPIPDTSLEQMDQRSEGEEKEKFLEFMRKMLQWDPKDREDSEGLYWDEWLLADLIESGEVGFVSED